jgi:hypothetical protein
MAHLNPLAVPFALPPPPPEGTPQGVPGAIVAPVNYLELYDTTRLPDAFLGVYAPWYAGMSTSLAGPQVNQPQAVRAGLLARSCALLRRRRTLSIRPTVSWWLRQTT